MNTHNHSGRDSTTAKKTIPPRGKTCPHWSSIDKSCRIVKTGLFLPLNPHTITYCCSPNHIKCMYYQSITNPETGRNKQQQRQPDRRRFVRIPSRHAFRFSEITPETASPGLQQDDAWTIDLGEGGFRIASRVPLRPKTTIQFLLVGDDSIPSFEGTGEISWAEALENTSFFHAGVVFDNRTGSSFSPTFPDNSRFR